MNIRHIIYLTIGLVVLVPLLVPLRLPVKIMYPVQHLFDTIEDIDIEKKGIIISVDYEPGGQPEVHPITIALLRHAFARRIKVGILTNYLQGLGLAEDAIRTVVGEFNLRATSGEDSVIYGRDYAFFGWQYPALVPILGMGESIVKVFPQDYYGNRLDTLPIMARMRNYNDVGILVSISSSGYPATYIAYAQNRYGVKIGAGVTAVYGADMYVYLQSGQLSGFIPGMKGGAEYEELVEKRLGIKGPRKATQAMSSQTAAHLLIMIFIIIGNIIYFRQRRKR